MNRDGEYKVGFGRTAGALAYEDNQGTIVFGFDINPAVDQEKGKWMILMPGSPKYKGKVPQIISSERDRVSLAPDKTKEYLLSRGYQVEMIDSK